VYKETIKNNKGEITKMKIVYQAGNVTGGYSFSANKEQITLSGYVENLPENIKEVILYEATTARELYVSKVKAKKEQGEKVSPLELKREAVEEAVKDTISKFSEEVYNEVQEVVASNKGGTQSVTGRTRPKKQKESPKKVEKAVPQDEIDDLEAEFKTDPADEFDAGFVDTDEDESIFEDDEESIFEDEEDDLPDLFEEL
jgi:hypothetical protein